MPGIYANLELARVKGLKQIAILVDPDKIDHLTELVKKAVHFGVDFFFVGGSLLHSDQTEEAIRIIRSHSTIPIILFPGSINQITPSADGILLLNLISGRNPEFLIGAHVAAAPALLRSGLEILSTSYILIDGGKPTTVSYISNTTPIPANKPDIAAVTALAGTQIGHKITYLDAGSGAQNPVSTATISAVRRLITNPLIVGGGIRTAKQLQDAFMAGADLAVIGHAFEENPDLLSEVMKAFELTTQKLPQD